MNYNHVAIAGNLTRDVELKYTPSNKAVAQIGVAVNHKYKTASGEQKEEVTFVDCEAWGQTAEAMSKYLSKGRGVFLTGRLKLETWTDKQSGANRSKLKVVVESFHFTDSKPDAQHAGSGQTTRTPAQRPAQTGKYEPIDEPDIPW